MRFYNAIGRRGCSVRHKDKSSQSFLGDDSRIACHPIVHHLPYLQARALSISSGIARAFARVMKALRAPAVSIKKPQDSN